MRAPEPGEVTRLLRRMGAGDSEAAELLVPLVYRELHAIARHFMADQRVGHTLQATALLNEAYVRLVGAGVGGFEDRGHFLRVAGAAMRSVLVDHARRRRAAKRGGGEARVPLDGLDEMAAIYETRAVDLLALNEALERLLEVDEELVRIVELRFFAGFDNSAVGEALGISTRSVERGWSTARAWLGDALGRGGS